ncbi:MAG TPA: hypothetical protein VHQ86_01105 [Candidatus Saccharimonadia bacterium]|nr:hypothetical protein [Candidatus Saccharimonadia bacterium]
MIIKRPPSLNTKLALPAVLVSVGVGILVVRIFAAGAGVSFLLSGATLASKASVVSNGGAIGGSMVVFGAATPTPTPAPTATPAPTPTPGGSCALPAYPNASCTGVPSGTTLLRVPQDVTSGSGWSWDGADQLVNVTGTGAVISGLNVSGSFYVTATGVTIKNTKAYGIGMAGAARYCHVDEDSYLKTLTGCTTGVGNAGSDPRLTVQDTEIDCHGTPGNTGTAIGDRNLNIYRVNIHGCENGFDVDSYVTITDSYIHDLYNSTTGDPHTDGLQSGVGSYLIITHNLFYGFDTGCSYPNDGSCNGTSAINIGGQPDHATSSNTTVSYNLVAGGAYTMYCPILAPSNFHITGNHFSTIYSSHVGEYGPTADCANGEINSGNVYHESGLPVTME